jgi:predicted ester cyclase
VDRRAIVTSVFEDGWNRRDFSTVAAALEEFEFHIRGTSRTMRLDDLTALVDRWHTGFPDLRFELHAVVDTEPFAAVHATLHGTNRGVWHDLAPTDRSIEVEHMFFFRFDSERIVDVWELLDPAAIGEQLGS